MIEAKIVDVKKDSIRKTQDTVIDESKVVIVVVGFKLNQENSVHYEKLHDPTPTTLGMSLWKALAVKGADFASVRKIVKTGEASV